MKIFKKYFELTAWITALILLASMNPYSSTHFSFCPLKFLGFNFCPGCGLGHSISFIFHGDFKESFHAHPLGFFALAMIAARIYKLLLIHIFPHFKKLNYGHQF